MESIVFSIILPVYNVAQYLKKCISSLIEQDFLNYEIILVDDGSTDSSGQICDEIAAQYEKIRIIHKENGGLSSARNTGLAIAKGLYVSFIDSDDWVEPGMYSNVWLRIKENNYPDIVKYNYIRRNTDGSSIKLNSNLAPGIYNREIIKDIVLYDKIYPKKFLGDEEKFILTAWSHIYRTDFLKQNNLCFVSERIIGSEDYLFNIQAYVAADNLLVLGDFLYSYNNREGSLTQRYKNNLFQLKKNLYLQISQTLIDKKLDSIIFQKLKIMFLRMVYYDVFSNECNRNPNWKEATEKIGIYLNDALFRDCLKSYWRNNCTSLKERFILLLMLFRQAKLIFILKKQRNIRISRSV